MKSADRIKEKLLENLKKSEAVERDLRQLSQERGRIEEEMKPYLLSLATEYMAVRNELDPRGNTECPTEIKSIKFISNQFSWLETSWDVEFTTDGTYDYGPWEMELVFDVERRKKHWNYLRESEKSALKRYIEELQEQLERIEKMEARKTNDSL